LLSVRFRAPAASGLVALLLAGLLAGLGPGIEAARAAASRTLTGEEVVAILRKQPFVEKRVTVLGPLNFRPLRNVAHPFICLDCVFNGPVSASDTTFQRSFDVSGAQFLGPVSMDRTTFLGPAVFGFPPGDRPTFFLGRSDFSLAQFASVTSFEAARFIGDTDFTLARFEKDAIFSGGVLSKQSTFARASFAGVADFRVAQFGDNADFEEAAFAGLADFSIAQFAREAAFKRVRFEGRASFFGSQFHYIDRNDFSARFDHATSVGVLDFSSAQFAGKTTFRGISAHILSFARAMFYARRAAVFDTDAVADSLVMSVHTADGAIEGDKDRIHVLQLIEASAKSRNDLGVANDAHYDLANLQDRGYWWPWRVLDQAFYGGIAGYFVRPFRPLATLLALVAFLALVRTLKRPAAASRPSPHQHRWPAWSLASVGAYVHRFVTELLDGMARIGRGGNVDSPPLAIRLEVFAYRVLVVCALLGFANSNPTLRQMFDALR
jgi:pentapeptide repeat protein